MLHCHWTFVVIGMAVDWLRQCNRLYEILLDDVKELGMLGALEQIHSELVPLLLAEKQIESSQLLNKSRIGLWSNTVKKRIDKLQTKLRPPQIFDNRVFDELRDIRRSVSAAELKAQAYDLTAIDDFRSILESIDRTSEYAERLRSKSAFDAVKGIFKTGIVATVTLFGVLITLGPQYLYWSVVPLGITVLVGAGVFGLIRVYPDISRPPLMFLSNVLIIIILVFLLYVWTLRP